MTNKPDPKEHKKAEPKLSVEDRLAILEKAALTHGWHLPHAVEPEPEAPPAE